VAISSDNILIVNMFSLKLLLVKVLCSVFFLNGIIIGYSSVCALLSFRVDLVYKYINQSSANIFI